MAWQLMPTTPSDQPRFVENHRRVKRCDNHLFLAPFPPTSLQNNQHQDSRNAETDSPLRTHDGDAVGHDISMRHVSGYLDTVPTKDEATSHTSRHSSYRSRQQRDSSIVPSVPSVLSSAGAAMARAARKKVIIASGRIFVMC